MAENVQSRSIGWGNQPRVLILRDGRLLAPESLEASSLGPVADLLAFGDGLYRLAVIVDDQSWNPLNEAKVAQSWLQALLKRIDAILERIPPRAALPPGLDERQGQQLRASIGVVLLSVAESQQKRSSRAAGVLVQQAMSTYFRLLEQETQPLLVERLVINLDWVMPTLPQELARQAKQAMMSHIPEMPPYDVWFSDGSDVLRIDWKCGSEFLAGWKRRLAEEGFKLERDGGETDDSFFTRGYQVGGIKTRVEMTIGPEHGNVFRKMGDLNFHIIGYDGHSDWGRKIPRSLSNAPHQGGKKVILYLLCCGKQILQKVRDRYPDAPLVTTFNSSRFTTDFRYSEDFSAFIHILDGIVRRERWSQIRNRVNKDWYNNPEANYLFPDDPIEMARSLDRDHDGQADMFDKLIDFNTFDVATDARLEFSPRVAETPPHQLVGTRLHFAVQVFHTLGHFNQVLEPFTHDLRVFSRGWYDPTRAAEDGVISRGPTRIRIEKDGQIQRYFFQGSAHFAHATEEAWRAIGTLALAEVVLARDPTVHKKLEPEERALTALLLVAHGLEIDDAWGRDEAVWRQLLPMFGLPESIPYSTVVRAKKEDAHWYAGSRASLAALSTSLGAETLGALRSWAQAPHVSNIPS